MTLSWFLMFYFRLAPPASAEFSLFAQGKAEQVPACSPREVEQGDGVLKLWLFLWLYMFHERAGNKIVHTSYLAGSEL